MKLNTIYRGDCKDILNETFSHVDDYFVAQGHGLPKEFADLIYMDPPFFSNRRYEQPWGDEKKTIGFDDNQWGYGEDGLNGVYLPYMLERIKRCYNVLKKTGTFYLHCDWHASHYLKQICDNVFGYVNFQDEIIWSFSKVGGTTKKFLKWHETIFRYTKSKDFTFNMDNVREPYSDSILKSMKKDEKGYYYTRGLGTDLTIKRIKKTYINEKGKIPGDVWNIRQYSPTGAERLGYPTQKPEELLEKIISVSSNPGGIILDPFCGCGTTIAVAYKLGRQFIGIDISEKACTVIKQRLELLGAKPELNLGMFTPEQLKNLSPMAFQDYIIEICCEGRSNIKKSNDKGIDGFIKEIPTQIKMNKLTRPMIDEFETALLRHYEQLGNTVKDKHGIIVGDGVPGDSIWREIQDAKKRGIDIEVVTIQECCDRLNNRLKEMEIGAGWT